MQKVTFFNYFVCIFQELKIKQKAELEKLKRENLEQYKISGSEKEWDKVLSNGKGNKTLISIKSGEKRITSDDIDEDFQFPEKKSKKDKSFKKNRSFK